MNSKDVHDWLQIIGAAAIVASLIFVGLQLKQTQEIAIASQYQARLDTLMNQYNARAESEVALGLIGEKAREIIETDDRYPARIKSWAKEASDAEVAYAFDLGYANMKIWDNLHFQYQSGFLDAESWDAYKEALKWDLQNSFFEVGSRQVFELNRPTWRQPFRELIEELIAEIDAEASN